MASNSSHVAAAVLSAFDTSMNSAWREEEEQWKTQEQEWHHQDDQWMDVQRLQWKKDRHLRDLKYRWRDEDMAQWNLENARTLWLRFVERNRRDVEEKSEQLKAISNLSAIFGGFAIVTLTQFQLQSNYSVLLCGIYGVLTALVEGLMTVSMVTCTLIMGCILKIGRTYISEQAEEEFIFQCFEFCQNYKEGDRPPCPKRTLEAFWESRCESSWQWAFFCFSVGVCLFIASLIVIGWIHYFSASKVTALIYAAILCVAILIWCGVQYSWSKYVKKKEIVEDSGDGDYSGLPYDWFLAPNIRPTE